MHRSSRTSKRQDAADRPIINQLQDEVNGHRVLVVHSVHQNLMTTGQRKIGWSGWVEEWRTGLQ